MDGKRSKQVPIDLIYLLDGKGAAVWLADDES
jgi:hypothetical protein